MDIHQHVAIWVACGDFPSNLPHTSCQFANLLSLFPLILFAWLSGSFLYFRSEKVAEGKEDKTGSRMHIELLMHERRLAAAGSGR